MEHDMDTDGSERGTARTRVLLLILLLLVAAGAYLYLFTDLIRPQSATEQAPVAVAELKQPMPQKPDATAVAGQPQEAGPAVPPTSPPPIPASVPPAGAPPSPAAKVPAATVTPKPAPAAPPIATSQSVKKNPEVPSAKPVAAPAAPPKAAVSQKPRQAVAKGAYLLVVGEYPTALLLKEASAKVRRAGLQTGTEKGVPRPLTMHRLLVGEYGDRGGAEASLQRVKTAGGQGFVLPEGDHFAVYAGSFTTDSKAAVERASLAARGITVTLRTATVPVPVTRLTAGRFATREEAQRAAEKLSKAGLKPTVTAR